VIYPTLFISAPLLLVAAIGDHAWSNLRTAVIGSLGAFAFFFVLNLIYPRGMAFGDVRFSAVLGLYLGWLGARTLFLGFFAAFLSGAVVGVALIATKRATRQSPIPFGVFLGFGAVLAVFFGRSLLHWYPG